MHAIALPADEPLEEARPEPAARIPGKHYRFKLTDADVVQIFLSADSTGVEARRHNITRAMVSMIRNRKVHVQVTADLVRPAKATEDP